MLDGKDILTTDESFDNLLNNIQMSLFLHPQCVSLFFPQTVARYIKDITKWPEDINNFPVVKAIISLNEYSEYTIHLFLTWKHKSHTIIISKPSCKFLFITCIIDMEIISPMSFHMFGYGIKFVGISQLVYFPVKHSCTWFYNFSNNLLCESWDLLFSLTKEI